MPTAKVEQTVEDIAKPIAESLGIALIDVEYRKEGKNHVLRVTIDKPEGVTIEDCEHMSRELDVKLDEADPIEESYSLEVQSPGELYDGKLLGLEKDNIAIMLNDGCEKSFDREKVSSVRLKINF